MIRGLHQSHTDKPAFVRPPQDVLHHGSSDCDVLHSRIHSDRAHSGDHCIFPKEVASHDSIIQIRYNRVNVASPEQLRQQSVLRERIDASTRRRKWAERLCNRSAQSEAGPTGLEPATSDVTGRRSSQLNYDPARNLRYQILDLRLKSAPNLKSQMEWAV